MYTDEEHTWEEEEDDDDITKEAVARFEEMLENQHPAYFDTEEFELIIDYYTQQNDLRKSRKAVDIALEQHPDDVNLKIMDARQLLAENNPSQALDLLNQIDGHFDEPEYSLTLASCYATLGKHPKAIDYYKKALNLGTDEDQTQNVYLELINSFLLANRVEDGVAFFGQRIDEDPHDVEAWSAIGDIYRRVDRLEEAIEMYEYTLAIDPTHLWANMHLANCYYDLNRFKEAIDSMHEALEHGVDTSMIHASLGDCHYRLEQYIDARTEYLKALERNEYLTEAWSGLGYVYSDTGDSKKAIGYFQTAYNLEPFNDDHLYNLAAEYRKCEENDKALNALLEIERHQPKDPDLYFFLGDLLAEMGRMDEAIVYVNLGLQRTDRDPSLLYLLAFLHLERTDRTNALVYLEEALQADPSYAPDFIEYDPEFLTNDVEVMEMIQQYTRNNPS